MGNCCVVLKADDSRKKVKKKEKKPNPFASNYNQSPIPSSSSGGGGSVAGKKLVVLRNPTGRDIGSSYELGPELGRGEFGITYLCTERSTGDAYACKSISKKKLRTSVDVEDVKREVEIMRHLPVHPNIVTLKDTFEDHNDVHLTMELCEGGELFDRIVARGHYTERAAAIVIKTIVEVVQVRFCIFFFFFFFAGKVFVALSTRLQQTKNILILFLSSIVTLQMCHKHGVMHRDLKPENFLYANKKENSPLKTIDFGLSIFFTPGMTD